MLPENVKTMVTYQSKKLAIMGNVQTLTVKMITCETDRRVIERVIDYSKRDKKSHVLGYNYQSDIKRKISESLFIKQLKPSLNKQDKSSPLYLYN